MFVITRSDRDRVNVERVKQEVEIVEWCKPESQPFAKLLGRLIRLLLVVANAFLVGQADSSRDM